MEGQYYQLENGHLKCSLCPRGCTIRDGDLGWCGVRKREGKQLIALTYGRVSSMHPDPIEKKPLYHFMPGSATYSMGSIGCNLGCQHCQNWSISQTKGEDETRKLRKVTPEDVVREAQKCRCPSVALTYNEPTIWFEFAKDIAYEAHNNGLKVVLVTNGFTSNEPAKEIGSFTDAANVDIKAFTDRFYKDICHGKLEPVRRNVQTWIDAGVHIELTYLVIPTHNDSEKEIREFARWAIDVGGKNLPIHFSRFFPHYKMNDLASTPIATVHRAREIAGEEGLHYVYVGNIADGGNNTVCPNCRSLLLKRVGFSTDIKGFDINNSTCKKCGTSIPIVEPIEKNVKGKRWWNR
ncbi:MAG: AmmeMemoRadiSam system radical SAM enzyme [Candidatus Heimdallarchaeota archaeon]